MASALDMWDAMEWFDYAKFLAESACTDPSPVRRAFSQSKLTQEVIRNEQVALPAACWIFERVRQNPHARPEAIYGALFSIAEVIKHRPDMHTRNTVEEMLEQTRPHPVTSSRLTPSHSSLG